MEQGAGSPRFTQMAQHGLIAPPRPDENSKGPPKIIRVGGQLFLEAFIWEVAEEVKTKALLADNGLDSCSGADRFAYSILHAAGYLD